jgi:hypothetical protein
MPTVIEQWNEKAHGHSGVECGHDCRVTCRMLTEAMRQEKDMIHFYEELAATCDYPDVQAFVHELLEDKSRIVLKINQKLNEIRARGQVSDGVISSFEPDA